MNNELDLFEKTMTVKEVAEAMGVSYSSVDRAVSKLFPTKKQNGKTTHLTEKEVALISRELKGEYHTSQMTFSAGEKVKNTTTELEVIGNAIQAFKDLQNLYNRKEEEYKAIIAEKDNQLAEQKPMVDGYQIFLASHNSFTMQKAAAMLKDTKGKSPYGRNNLIRKLKQEGILMPNGLPYRDYIDRGYFEVHTSVQNGIAHDSTLIFPKGMDYLAKKLSLILEYAQSA